MVPVPDADPADLSATAELLARIKAGDPVAFGDLMGRYRSLLHGFLHARLPPTRRALCDTDDALQDIGVKVWKALATFEDRGVGAFWMFLRQIARNRLTDEWRRAGRNGERSPAAGPDGASSGANAIDPRDPAPTPAAVAISAEEQEQFETALASVPEPVRRAVVLRLELRLDYGAIASDVGFSSPDAVRVAIRRALTKVAAELAERGEAE